MATTRPRTSTPALRRLSLPAGHAALAPGRALVRDALREAGWRAADVEEAVLALCEALTNAVEHGSRPGAPVTVEVSASAGSAEVRVTDLGRPGSSTPSPVRAAPPPSSERGRGLLIMCALADRLVIRRAGRGTEVRLAFEPRS